MAITFVRIMMANLRTFGRIICTTFAAVHPYNASLLLQILLNRVCMLQFLCSFALLSTFHLSHRVSTNITIDPYNFELYRLKVDAFFKTQCTCTTVEMNNVKKRKKHVGLS